MNVTLPDGTTIEGVPEGTTKAQLADKLKANGHDVPNEWLAPAARQSPKQMSYRFGGDTGSLIDASEAFGAASHKIEQGINEAGGMVTDVASKMGASPETAAKAGYVANVGLNALPIGPIGKVGGVTTSLQNVGRSLMQSAVKPTIAQLKSGDAALAIETMLKEGINPTTGGVEKLRGKIGELNDQIKDAIANSTETIKKSDVGKRLIDTYEQFKKQVNPKQDLDAIVKAWTEFRSHPLLAGKTEIPVQLAQELKQGTYKQLAKKYGQMGSSDIEAQKGLARGLKEEIANKVPEIAGLNKQESDLIKTLNVAERRALMELNKNPAGLSLLTTSPAKFAAFMADKSAVFKSLVARMVYSSAPDVGKGAMRMTVPLAEIGAQGSQP